MATDLEQIIESIKNQGIIEAFGDGVSIQDTNFKILFQNQVHIQFIGNHVGEYCYSAYEKQKSTCEGCPLAKTFNDGKVHMAERAAHTERGDEEFEITSSPIKDVSGKIIGGIEIVRNITDRKISEEKLRRERDKAQMYLDVAGVILLVLDTHGNICLINKRGCDILGHREEDIIGKNWFENFLPARIRSEVFNVFQKLMSGQADLVKYHENPVLARHGEERIVAWNNVLLKDDHGTITATLSSGEDVTLRRKIEQELKERVEELELFYNTAIGRELKMKELKTELEEIKAELRKKSQQ